MREIRFLKEYKIAHRGIYNNKNISENSILAFEKAMNRKEMIELDIHLTKDEKNNTSYVTNENKGKKCVLEYTTINTKDNLSLVKINLLTGRHHQIRVQFSHNGYPLYGDHKYNKNFINDNKTNIALIATDLSFYHPTTKELLSFKIDLPKRYPYNIF